MLAISDRPDRLRNVGVLLVPGARHPQFGRILASQLVEFSIAEGTPVS
jgi:hypothetical protein